MSKSTAWDTELYEAQHSFVWKMGEALLETLAAKAGELVLDLGCGTGQLTSAIAETGASVLGLDASPDMIGQARQNYPRLQFLLQDACTMSFEAEFDAIFSNAALHWILDGKAAIVRMAKALRPGGRLVAELGGKGNVSQIHGAIEQVVAGYGAALLPPSRTYFPSVGTYAGLLEEQGLEVRSALLFDRPTSLDGPQGMERWIRQFAFYYFERLNPAEQTQAVNEVISRLRPWLWRDGVWMADYRRLRVYAVKL